MMAENPAIAVDDADVSVEATADGQTDFAFDFPIYDKEQLTVTINGGDALLQGNFTVDQVENAEGGIVTLDDEIAADIVDGDVVRIKRVTPIAREVKYIQQAVFRAYSVNRDFDLLIMILQELRRDADGLADADLALAALIEAEAVARELADDRLEGIINAMIQFETGDNTLGGLTRAAIPAIAIDEAITYLRTIGESAPDEGPAENLVEEVAEPAHGNFVLDLNGRIFANNSRTQTLYTVGKNVHDEILAKLVELEEKGGGELIIKDEHLVADGVEKNDFASDLVLNFQSGREGGLVIGTGVDTPLMRLFPADPYTGKLTIIRPRIDCSDGDATAGESSSTGLALGPWEQIHVERGFFTAGRDPSANKGDSGISVNAALYSRIEDCYFEGWSDAAIYPGGGAVGDETDDGTLCEVINCSFERNTWCITAKRQLSRLAVNGGYGFENIAGIGTFQVSAALHSARQVDIVGFAGRKFQGRILELNGITKARIIGLSLIDWGYDPLDPDTIVGANPTGIELEGVSGIHIENLLLAMRDWDGSAAHFGLSIANQTVFAQTYTSGDHYIQGAIEGVFRAISEGASVDPSRFILRRRDWTQVHGASQPAASVYEISNDGARPTVEVASTTYIEPTEQAYFKTTGTLLSSLGTLAATTTGATVTVPLVGAAAGDVVQFQPTSAGAAANPALSYSWRAITDAVEVTARNNGGSGFDFTAQTFICTAQRRPNNP